MKQGDVLAKRYKINKLIGQGGMADVYVAYDILLEREVAIKIVRSELSNDAVSLLRFKHEAVAVSKLNHPNIIEIFDIGVHDSRQYIVMEYIEGQTLKELIAERNGIYKEEAVLIMKQLVSAISEAHNNEIIHRDIKPQNILCKSDGSIIITDFGIALAENSLHLTQKETVMGSVHYLAPELARGEKASFQSDIYALGIVFYELLSGKVPFKGETAVQIALQQINKPMPSIKEFNPSIPQSIENVIIKSTLKNQDLRYKSAALMLEDLETVFDESRIDEPKYSVDLPIVSDGGTTKVLSHVTAIESSVEEKPKQPKNKNKKRNIIIASIISILLLATIIFAMTRKDPVAEVEMPNLVGLTLVEAREVLEQDGLLLGEIKRELSDEYTLNQIIEQNPKAKSLVKEGSEIDLLVSEGKYYVIDDYFGRNFDEVRVELENALNVFVRVEYIDNSSFAPGQIYSQSIAKGTKLNPYATVDIKFVVIKSKEVSIPNNIYGMNIYEAKAILEGMGAKVTLRPITDKSDEFIARQTPNVVDYTVPAKNSNFNPSSNNAIVIYYYEKVVLPEPKPNDENLEPKPEVEIPNPELPKDEEEKPDKDTGEKP